MKFSRYTSIATQSGAGTVNSAAIEADQMFAVSAQVTTTGTLAGALQLQGSNDAPNNAVGGSAPIPTNWSDISGAVATVSAAGTLMIPKTELCYRYIRFHWVPTSGTGNITVNSMVLGI